MKANYILKTSGVKRYLTTSLFVMLLALLTPCLHAQLSYTFTPCGATGSLGPTAAQVSTAYASTSLNGSVTVSATGIQSFTIPVSGAYQIEAYGAAGGTHAYAPGYPGGKGAYVSGEFNLNAGTVIYVIVGQKGGDSKLSPTTVSNDWDNAAPGGGGGSFVYTLATAPFPLVAAGGGGAGARTTLAPNANTTTAGNDALTGGLGGQNGNGGQTNSGGNSYWAGAGAGWLTDGTGGNNATNYNYSAGSSGATGGRCPANGGAGGVRYNDGNDEGGDGGFGGGGGGGSDNMGTGGGGGFSGGGGGRSGTTPNENSGGGGGGSYNGGINQINTASVTTGDGKVIITLKCDLGLGASSNPMCQGASVTLTSSASGLTWNTGATSPTIVVSPSVTTTYSVGGSGTNGTLACTGSAIITIVVNPLPTMLSVVVPNVICPGGSSTVTLLGASTYTVGSSTSSPYVVSPSVTTVYTYSGTNVYGCVNTGTFQAKVSSSQINIIASSPSVCAGNTATLTAVGANTYTWNTGNNFPALPVTPTLSTTYTVTGRDAYFCLLSKTASVSVVPKPNVTVVASKTTICKGESIDLTASGAANYVWSIPGASGSSVNVSLPVDVVYNYSVIGTDANGCKDTAYVTVVANKCTGIKEQSGAGNAVIYPNPSSGQFFVELANGEVATKIEVVDLTGRLLLSVTPASGNRTDIDLTKFPGGIYYVNVHTVNAVERMSVIKQ